MNKAELKKLIEIASDRQKADIVLMNLQIVDVYTSQIIKGDVSISDKYIAGIGNYQGIKEIDYQNKYLAPGFIDAHIHVECALVSPEELGSLLVARGCTTIIAYPHEIVNVCGLTGLDYMLNASNHTALDIKYLLPACVPCSPFETSGAIITDKELIEPIKHPNILGLA